MTIEWEDPPPSRTGRPKGVNSKFRNELDTHPGKWAVLSRDAFHAVGKYWQRLGYEVSYRSNGTTKDGKYRFTIYVRKPEI